MALFEGYSVDDLNRVLNLSRWTLGVLALFTAAAGVFNQWVTGRIADLQRAEKAKAQERLAVSEAELQSTKAKTVELAQRLAPRSLSTEQRAKFVAHLTNAPKGPVVVAHSGQAVETVNFAEQIRSLLEEAGYPIAGFENPLGYVIKAAPAPWFMALVVGTGETPPHALPLLNAFKEIGIETIPTDGRAIAQPGEIKVYVGAK